MKRFLSLLVSIMLLSIGISAASDIKFEDALTQQKRVAVLIYADWADDKDSIVQASKAFEEECHPLGLKEKEYAEKEKALNAKKADALLHAELIFFFKFDEKYFMIPDDITTKIIQGLGNKVFTKVFRVEVPHNGFVEAADGIPFKIVTLVNYGDVKLYKCNGEAYGEQITVYINKEREIELGSTVNLVPDLAKTEIYENQLNIRLY